jgi:hypothetical protein
VRRYSIALVMAAALGALVVSFANAAPPPSHELALRELIDGASRGQVDERRLTPELAAAVRPQLALAHAELSALGPLRSVTFVRTDQSGSDIYLTTFERGTLEWAFALSPDGRISNAMYRKLPVPAG